jgi:HSP20 family molecular chaperone IbpA
MGKNMLWCGIDRSRVSARLDQGVLRIFLPKAEALKPRRIEVAG